MQCFLSAFQSNNPPRIGPRKLSRVLRHAKDSTVTRQDSDYGLHIDRANRQSPTTIRGDNVQQKPVGASQQPSSYFDLPRDRVARSPNSLITPVSFIQASSADSPEVASAVDGQVDASAEQPAPDAGHSTADTLLLVEDNAINMRVRIYPPGYMNRYLPFD